MTKSNSQATLKGISDQLVNTLYKEEGELRQIEAKYLSSNSVMLVMSYFLREASKSPLHAANLLEKWREEHDQHVANMAKIAFTIEAVSFTKMFVKNVAYFTRPNDPTNPDHYIENLKNTLVGKKVFVRMGNIPEYFPGELMFEEEKRRFYIERFKDETFFELSEVLDADLYNSFT